MGAGKVITTQVGLPFCRSGFHHKVLSDPAIVTAPEYLIPIGDSWMISPGDNARISYLPQLVRVSFCAGHASWTASFSLLRSS